MSILSIVLLIPMLIGTAYYILSTLALIAHFAKRKRRKRQVQTQQPRVSILKPVNGLDFGARDNFISYLTQNYSDYEVLFGVLDKDDPSANVISDVIKPFPNASLHIGSDIDGANNKVRILHNLLRHSDGEIIVITDADTRVTPGFLRRIIAPFENEGVGAVTCMYRGSDAMSIGDALEGLHMTCVFAPGVVCAAYMSGVYFGLGAAIAIRGDVLSDIGGFEAIVDYLADDFQLGKRAAAAGCKVELSDYVVDVVLCSEDIRSVITRELRWAQTTKVSNPPGYLGYAVTHGFAYAVLFLLASGFSAVGWLVLYGVAAVRIITAYIGACKCLGDREFTKRILLLPVRDLLSPLIWIAAYFTDTITWRGRKLRLNRDGQIAPIK